MQLVMRRNRLEGTRRPFAINARMVLDAEEAELLTKYRLHNVILTEGNSWRDIRKSLLLSVGLAFIISLITSIIFGFLSDLSVVLTFVFFICSWYLIYQQIREEVRVDDLITGRDFKARSFVDLLHREHMIRKMSAVFAKVVEQAKTWEEPEVIELEPQPLLTVLEGGSREAA